MKRFAGVALAVLLLLAITGRADEAAASSSMTQYHLHLQRLQFALAACASGRSRQTCDATLVGPDDSVQFSGDETRLVSYAWLREVFARARTRPADTEADAQTTRLLRDAAQRLAEEAAPEGPAAGASSTQLQQAHATLQDVLADRQFPPAPQPGVFARARDWLLNWLAEHLLGLAAYSSRSRWIPWAVMGAALALAAAALFWWLRRGLRMHAAGASRGMAADLPAAAPDWQRWLAEADTLAESGRWRDGIHSVYWAAIARLESRGLWRTDRSRTPREYLGLLPSRGARSDSLAQLTRTFERTWYGEQPAGEAQYRAARAAFDELASA